MNFLEQTYFAYPKGITKKICNEIIEFGESKRLNEGEIGDNIKVTKIRNSQPVSYTHLTLPTKA